LFFPFFNRLLGTGKLLVITNGTSFYMKAGDQVLDKPPKDKDEQRPTREALLRIIARLGAEPALMEKKVWALEDPTKVFLVKGFKLGAKEKVGDREAQIVHYQIEDKRDGDVTEASIWIDTQTQLPLKRVLAGKTTDGRFTMTETYVFTVDSKLEDKLFEIPPK